VPLIGHPPSMTASGDPSQLALAGGSRGTQRWSRS
jgi:hypothetical protein